MTKIVGIGACTADLLYTIPTYPREDSKTRAVSFRRAGGGPVATGLCAARKLGVSDAFIGTLADDPEGVFLKEDFVRFGVGTDFIRIEKGHRSFTASLWLSERDGTRTCVFDRGDLPPLYLDDEQKEAVAKADILMVDGNELPAALEAAHIARENGTKVLFDCGGLYDGVEALLEFTDFMIPSEEFALGITGKKTAEEAAAVLMERFSPACVVVTRGKRGGILCDGTGIAPYPVFPAAVVDSNGAGDVFHGAFAAGLIKGFDPKTCCLFASAVSALKCTGLGARDSTPDFETVKAFMKENGYEI